MLDRLATGDIVRVVNAYYFVNMLHACAGHIKQDRYGGYIGNRRYCKSRVRVLLQSVCCMCVQGILHKIHVMPAKRLWEAMITG
jgi:hypothetical protein